jgi:precorrin-6B methylase 2
MVDLARLARLQHLADRTPERMTRYELDQLTAMAIRRRVAAGPFMGMRYLKVAHGSVLSAKLLGTYELELHAWLGSVLQREFSRVWVIGSGEGYYAVGLARLLPTARVLAFDIDPNARRATRQLAGLNQVDDRIEVDATCSANAIATARDERSLVVCDIEGGELELLTSVAPERFSHCDLIVEVHDTPPATTTLDKLLAHFATTHTSRIKTAKARDTADVVWPPRLSNPRLRERLVGEGRYRGNRWIYFTPLGHEETR